MGPTCNKMVSAAVVAYLTVFCVPAAQDTARAEAAPLVGAAAGDQTQAGEGTGAADSDKTPGEAEGKDRRPGSSSQTRPLPIVVVVSKKNPVESLTVSELRRVFLRKKMHWPNRWPITVYERSVEEEIRRRFSKDVFNKKPESLKEYWINLQLTRGLKGPKVLRSAKLVKRYLQRVKGGIGYLYKHEVDDTVKVIRITDADHAGQEK